jgi:hypothetical protein
MPAFGAQVSTSSLDLVVGGAGQPRAFPGRPQEHDNWCWAAVMAALLQDLRNQTVPQCAIVGQFKGFDCCPPAPVVDEQASLADIFAIESIPLGATFHGLDFFQDGQAAFGAIRASLDANRPVPILIAWDGPGAGSAHYVCAFDHTTVAGQDALWIFDPGKAWTADGNRRLRTVTSMAKYGQSPGPGAAFGHWAEAYILT